MLQFSRIIRSRRLVGRFCTTKCNSENINQDYSSAILSKLKLKSIKSSPKELLESYPKKIDWSEISPDPSNWFYNISDTKHNEIGISTALSSSRSDLTPVIDLIIKYRLCYFNLYSFNVITLDQFAKLLDYLSVANTNTFSIFIRHTTKNRFNEYLHTCGRKYICDGNGNYGLLITILPFEYQF